jgi:hypothetical protein
MSQSRVSDIARAIHQTCTPILSADSDRRDAKDALANATDGATSVRESILGQIASMAHADNWTETEIKAATKLACAGINDQSEKTLATFISETRRVAHPLVRAHFGALVDLRNAAWDAEENRADKSEDAPIKRAFKRKYHFLLSGLCGAAQAGKVLETIEDAQEYARANDPDHDASKVLKRVQAMREELTDIMSSFPVEDLQAALDSLLGVSKEALEVARREHLRAHGAAPQPSTAPVIQPVTTVVKPNKPAPKATPATQEVEPAQGAVDLMDAMDGLMAETMRVPPSTSSLVAA